MIMKKMIFSVATILFLGITTTICAQEPVKKDTTKTEPAKNFAFDGRTGKKRYVPRPNLQRILL